MTGVDAASFVLRAGGYVTIQRGAAAPAEAELADGQLEHKTAAGAFGPPVEVDWDTLRAVGAQRNEAAEAATAAALRNESL